MIDYGFTKELIFPFAEAIGIVTEALKKAGFGILTKIDVQEKFEEKLGIDFKEQVILGAGNPSSAHQAILAEENIGLMLPGNVVVQQKGDKSVVSIIRPTVAMKMIDNEELRRIAVSGETKLKKVFGSLKQKEVTEELFSKK